MRNHPHNLEHQNKSVDSRIVVALERISQVFRILLWNESKALSLSPTQVQVLIFLLNHGIEKGNVSFLASEFDVTKASMSETIKVLLGKKLVKKIANSVDSRSQTICLTPKGKDMTSKTSLFASELQKPVERMGTDEKTNLLLSLLEMIHHLNVEGVITEQRMCFSCANYRSGNKHGGSFCTLLNAKLATSDLRLDCPEHKKATVVAV